MDVLLKYSRLLQKQNFCFITDVYFVVSPLDGATFAIIFLVSFALFMCWLLMIYVGNCKRQCFLGYNLISGVIYSKMIC